MKKFLAVALLGLSLFAMGCNKTPDSTPSDKSSNDASGGQPPAPGGGTDRETK